MGRIVGRGATGRFFLVALWGCWLAGCGDGVEEVVSGPTFAQDVQAHFDGAEDIGPGVEDADEGADLGAGPETTTPPAQPCAENNDCTSGYCIDTFDGLVCAQSCLSDCPQDFVCKLVSSTSGDASSICVPRFPRLCEPCQADADCSSALGGDKSLCVPYGDGTGDLGHFCGGGCGDDVACPSGWQCEEVVSAGGAKAKQCRRQDLTCPCSARARELGLSTACATLSEAGSCQGKRGCSAQGLSACDAPAAASETCDLKDEDCDGQTDEGMLEDCDDANPCTADACSGGECSHLPAAGECDDANACTEADACKEGVCDGAGIDCDDNDPCSADACDKVKGCGHTGVSGLACDDGDVCTPADSCKAGVCLPGSATDCDDGNPCTDDGCDSAKGCSHAANILPCSDGDVCSLGDTCKDAACSAVGKQNCDDGNPCTDDACDPINSCQHAANDKVCDDGNACTSGDSCLAGACIINKAVSCDDGKICTTDSCDPAKGCSNAANNSACDDKNACTVADTCKDGACSAGKAQSCDDGNGCTIDSCDMASGCTHVDDDGAQCEDGSVCSEADACLTGKCVPGQAKMCDDSNGCTSDACDHLKGCTYTANALPCDDGDACTTGDGCTSGKCGPGKALPCADGNVCTDDACNPASGCVFTNNVGACSDGNACSVEDSCKGGACGAGKPKVCVDDNVCTTEGCHWQNGCLHVANTAPCDDGDACTEGDACKDKACAAGEIVVCDDKNPCTDDSCDKAKGCVFGHNDAPCTDGDACTEKDGCLAGQCIPGFGLKCDDNNPCTDDGCAKLTGCSHSANSADCSDNNACTVKDGCKDSVCVAGPAPNCDDGIVCTDDACDANAGCTHGANNKTCDDGNTCTKGDVCASGACKPGPALKCDDANPCTANTCDKGKGCQTANVANGTDCGGGKWCQTGKCVVKAWGAKDAPALSCQHILETGNSKGNGSYWLDPNGGGIGDAFQATCLMSVAAGGWTRLYPNVASSLHGNTTKEYLYLYGNRWYRSPKTTLVWSWSSGKQLTGSYAYFNGSSNGAYTCSGSGEKPSWGVGCSNGGGGQYKTLTYYGKNPNAAQGTVCQDKPGALCKCACQGNVTMYVRGH